MHIAEYVVVIRDVVIVYSCPLNVKHSIPFTQKIHFMLQILLSTQQPCNLKASSKIGEYDMPIINLKLVMSISKMFFNIDVFK